MRSRVIAAVGVLVLASGCAAGETAAPATTPATTTTSTTAPTTTSPRPTAVTVLAIIGLGVLSTGEQLRLTVQALRRRQRGAGIIAAGFAGGLLALLLLGRLLVLVLRPQGLFPAAGK